MEMIRRIVRVGNSAGIVLPKEWYGGEAKVELIKKPISIEEDILKILKPYLSDILGVYLVGSYARNEQTRESDVDVLIITNSINKKIVDRKYNILMITLGLLKEKLDKSALPILPMIKEARPIINSELIRKYKEKAKLTKRNTKPIIDLAKSSLGIVKASIDLDKEWPSNSGDAAAYSLVLHIRSIYLANCLRKNKEWSSRGLKSIIKSVSGSLKAYEGYLRVKNNKKIKEELPIDEAGKLYDYLKKEVERAERWLKEKKG